MTAMKTRKVAICDALPFEATQGDGVVTYLLIVIPLRV